MHLQNVPIMASFKPNMRWHFTVLGIVFVLAFLNSAAAQTGAEISITRDDQTIIVKQAAEATSESGARFIPPKAKDCEDGLRLGSFYAPGENRVSTLINSTLLLSNIVLVKIPDETQNEERLELLGGSAEFTDKRCPEVEASPLALVRLIEGATDILGSKFNYDNLDGISRLAGPITLIRDAENQEDRLSATAGSLFFDTNEDIKVLEDGVTIEAGGRSSTAETVEWDEQAGIAILRGSPAKSTLGTDVVSGQEIKYFLDSNEVEVLGGIEATFNF